MLTIRRTEDGRLHLSNNRQSDTALDEGEARRKLHRWGHTDLSISKALAEMRSAAGEVATASAGWRVLRPANAAETRREAAAAAAGADSMEENQQSEEKPVTKRSRSRRSAPRVADQAEQRTDAVPSTEAQAEPMAASRKRRSRSAASAGGPPAAEPVSVPGAESGSEGAAAGAKRTRRRKTIAPVEAAEVPSAAAATSLAAAPVAAAPAPARKRARRAPSAEPFPVAPQSDSPSLERALALLRDGAAELRRLEGEVLPFAREPWTELREKAEFIVSCLQGKKRPGA